MADYTTTALLAAIRRRAMLPTASDALDDTDLLAFANGELQGYIAPLLVRVREEYLVAYDTVSIVANTAAYPIPWRAIGSAVRDVQLLVGSTYVPVRRLEPGREWALSYSASNTTQFYRMEGDNIVLCPTPTASGTLRVVYHRRPNVLVSTGYTTVAAGSTTSILKVALNTALGSTGTTLNVDVVRAKPGFQSWQDSLSATIPVSPTTDLTVSWTVPSNMAAGDYVCKEGESPVPQVPFELHDLLVQRTAVKALEAMNDAPGLANAKRICDEMEHTLTDVLQPRTQGSPRFVVNLNGPGFAAGRWRAFPRY